MSIKFIKDKNQFILNTKNTSYIFQILNNRYLCHLYYGKKVKGIPNYSGEMVSFSPYREEFGDHCSPDLFGSECSFFGSGDFRACALRLHYENGSSVTDFVYDSYRIFKGRYELDGLPYSRADENTKTLEVTLYDTVSGCRLLLYYTVFEKEDIISRYIKMENKTNESVKIEKCMSFTLDIDRCDLDMVSFYGRHNFEMNYQRTPLHHGLQSVFSRRGTSSHQYNPFFALCSHGATDEKGEVFGFNFVYSGSFLNEVEVDQMNRTRVQAGLGSECFTYTIFPNEYFISPEAILTYSSSGFNRMRQNLHNFVRNRILPPVSLNPHPVVLNTWEACYFNIDENLLLQFAEESQKVGFDMLVMDDGWFGARNNDCAGLGDWIENRTKFPEGLSAFVKKIKSKGIKFGIWIEPEMVNPDSDLYRTHPEWCLHTPGRAPSLSRSQLVLDMSNNEVVDHLISTFDKTFSNIEIDYFKWDMNRHLTDIGSTVYPPEKQGEISFRYMKGVYRLLDWFNTRFPNAVIETCSGGGGRYDLGMMRYGFQIWTSDNTDPYARTFIQSSALLAYPATTMSCHVSNPHGNMRSLDYRYKVALGGMLGYELNILNMNDEIKAEISKQIKEYKQFEHLMRLGDYFELASPVKYDYSAYYYASKERDEILLSVIEKDNCKKGKTKLLKIKCAMEEHIYTDALTGKKYSGKELRHGLTFDITGQRDTASLLFLKRDI